MIQKGSVEEQQASYGSSIPIFCVLTVPEMKHLLQFIIVGPIFLYYFPRARAIFFLTWYLWLLWWYLAILRHTEQRISVHGFSIILEKVLIRRTIRGCGESGVHMRQLLEVCPVMTTEPEELEANTNGKTTLSLQRLYFEVFLCSIWRLLAYNIK